MMRERGGGEGEGQRLRTPKMMTDDCSQWLCCNDASSSRLPLLLASPLSLPLPPAAGSCSSRESTRVDNNGVSDIPVALARGLGYL